MNILVVYYSMYGHIYELAQAVAKGSRSVQGANVKLAKVPELIPESVFAANPAMQAGRDLQKDVPVATNDDLTWADGILFGSPTRFGNMCSQLKNFLDQTGALWVQGTLIGKPAGCFTGTGTPHGGQETTLVSMYFPLIAHGMIIVGVPYSVPEVSTTTGGGGPYGPATLAGPQGDRKPDEAELTIARHLGKRVAEIAGKLKG